MELISYPLPITRQILNHRTTREVPEIFFFLIKRFISDNLTRFYLFYDDLKTTKICCHLVKKKNGVPTEMKSMYIKWLEIVFIHKQRFFFL